jgi:CHAT domain-containing protein
MSALHDGERFLIERFAIGITPGLSLTDPKPLNREGARLFAGGISEAIQGHAPLPHVRNELESISAIFDATVLLDQEFQRLRIERELRNEAFSIVHIASHAFFDPNAEETYVLTHDGRLSMDDLASFVGLFRFRDQPLDLLMLSACETAAGDDRSALGLSGLAIKAGARSAVGSLWSVNDEAASELVTRFYQNLKNPSLSRAQALQRAQLALIAEPRFRHPAYWSAFILISNWL